jgi:hypothetical protein
MPLRWCFLIYLISTAAAVAAPYAMTTYVNALHKAIPVNSEPPLEPAPALQPRRLSYDDSPACIAYNSAPFNETIYYHNGKQSDSRDPGREIRPFIPSARGEFESCSVGIDGTVYVPGGSGDRTWSLAAYDPTGKLRWRVSTQELRSRTAMGNHGIVYLHSRARTGTTVLTAYRADGAKLWETPIGGTGWSPSAPAIAANGTIYVIAESFTAAPQLVAVSTDGKEIWRVTIPGAVVNAGELIVSDDGRIFVQVHSGVIAFNENGEKLWEFSSNNQDLDGGIALAGDGTLYVASRFLYALDKAGKSKWDFKSERTYTDRDYFGHQPIVAKDGTIYANSYYDQLYAITPDGRKKWVVSGEPRDVKRAWGQPTLTKDGTLLTQAGWFDVRSGLATAGWPSENRDNRNSRQQGDNP